MAPGIPPIAIPPASPVGMEMGTGPQEGALAEPPTPLQCPGVRKQGVEGPSRGLAGSSCGGARAQPRPPAPHQAMDPSGAPSVPLMIGCAVSCMALLTLLVIYAAFWR